MGLFGPSNWTTFSMRCHRNKLVAVSYKSAITSPPKCVGWPMYYIYLFTMYEYIALSIDAISRLSRVGLKLP